MFASVGTHRRLLAAVLAFAVPVFVLGACNDDPLFDLPPDPPTNVAAVANGQDVTVNWTPGVNATSQEVRLTPVVAVPLSAGNALQAEDYVAVYNDNTTATHTFTDVEPGAYTATVTAINASSRAPSEVATVTVEGAGLDAPTITSFGAVEGSSTTLRIEWTDVEGEQNYRVTATPDDGSTEFIDIASANATFFEFSDAVVGATYTAEVCAIYSSEEACSATAQYTVAENQAPTAEITAPADASEFFDTELITFTGTGTDAEDGALTGASLVWTSDVDGELGTGVELLDVDASTVTPGAHVITLTATDSEGATGAASINITINEATSVNSFSVTIGPYFADNCTGCHGGASPTASVALDSWEGVVRSVSTASSGGGPTVVIGDAEATEAVLLPTLRAAHQDGPDDEAVANQLETWINDGAPNN